MQTRTSMRHIREALRLVYQQGMSRNKAAQALKVGKSTLKEFVKRFEALGMSLEGALSLSDDDLQGHLYPTIPARLESRQKPPSALYQPVCPALFSPALLV
jgi:hypothetical protein